MIPNEWNKNTYKEFIKYLNTLNDEKYKEFNSTIVNTSKYEMIGIRLPIIRRIVKDISKTNIIDYLSIEKGNYYEEILIEGLVISILKDEKTFYKYFKNYIDKIDNWAICDTFASSIKIVEKYPDKYFNECIKLINTNIEYKVRLGLVIILNHFINENNISKILEIIDNIKTDKYYINMARAWLLAEIYIKHKDKVIDYIKNNNLDKFTQNKTISKINDSYRISKEEKEELKKYKSSNSSSCRLGYTNSKNRSSSYSSKSNGTY